MATKLEHELGQLETLSREELCARWRAAYGCPPPEGARRSLLIYAAGWHLQVKRSGGFSGETRRMLHREVEQIMRERQPGKNAPACKGLGGTDASDIVPAANHSVGIASQGNAPTVSKPVIERRKPVSGDRLLREWNGKTHVVDVTNDGYLHDGRTYWSLTAIARQITGVHWSGPRFFGL